MRNYLRGFLSLAVALSLSRVAQADQTLVFDGDVPAGGPDHFFVPFEVPAGTVEIEVRHDDLSEANILDWGLDDPNGYRGWGGGTTEPAVVGERASSRAYVRGPIPTGTWRVIAGKAKVVASPAKYHVEIDLRTAPKLPPQEGKVPYAAAAARKTGRRYYAGDFHTHSLESTDARPPLAEMVAFAKGRGLDFIEISDHNTITQLDDFDAVGKASPDFLLVPGIEYTTYAGHANAIGATRWVDHKIGQPGVTIEGAASAIHGQGALFALNHPTLDIGTACIGCAFKQPVDHAQVDAIEISTGGVVLLFKPTLALWDSYLAEGRHVAPIGGSDDHQAGKDAGGFQGGIGSPTTLVLADELSVAAILDGIKKGRTVVKMVGPKDPMVELEAGPKGAVAAGVIGDTVAARARTFRATITGGNVPDAAARFVKNGEILDEVPITADPFVLERTFEAPATGEDRLRVEVVIGSTLHTVTGHMWLRRDPAGPDDRPVAADSGCQSAGGSADGWATGLLLAIVTCMLQARRTRRSAG